MEERRNKIILSCSCWGEGWGTEEQEKNKSKEFIFKGRRREQIIVLNSRCDNHFKNRKIQFYLGLIFCARLIKWLQFFKPPYIHRLYSSSH